MPDIRVDTPESVDLTFETGGLGSRFLAAVVDGALQWAVAFLLFFAGMFAAPLMIVGSRGRSSAAVGALGAFFAILFLVIGLLFFLYKLLLEAFWNGQTLGKRVAGIRVVSADGLPVRFWQVLVRNLLRPIDFFPGFYLIGSICILASQRAQRLGDMAAGTVVVREQRAVLFQVPQALSHPGLYDLVRLREHVLRLSEPDLNPARGYWQRRRELDKVVRDQVAKRVAQGLAARMAWPDALPGDWDGFIEAVLYVRAR